jgi:hypothetical protein
MNQIVLPHSTVSEFLTCSTRTELLDETGKRIGFFEPAKPHDPELYARARLLFSDEEIARRRQERGGRTTPEVFARLHAMQAERDAARRSAAQS